ncbi:mechanosensitive ion channel family protein [Chitinophaga defluvii]|uniref:Mechanosensitive ion channel domain-containing protein n=1 Tax=Chitinophaga defluvii TaxID=3163343 RepID=A0ABV2T2R3_9BACT
MKVHTMMMDLEAKRKNRKERVIFFIKLLIFLALLYFNHIQEPDLYVKYPTLDKLTNALALFLSANLLISLGWLIIISWYIRKNQLKTNVKDNFVLGINRIASVLNTVFFIVAIMLFFDIHPKQFLTSISIVAAAIALLFRDYITNMINGLIIMFSDQLSLGDHIVIGEHSGKIQDITLVNVVMLNDDDDVILIPNSSIFTSLIVNQSKQNIKKVTVEFELDHKHLLTLDVLEQRLQNVLSPYNNAITPGTFLLRTLEIKKDMARFKVQLLLSMQDKKTERAIRRMLYTEILAISKE